MIIMHSLDLVADVLFLIEIQNQPFYFIQIAVDGESMRRRFSAPHQFAANAQEQIALRRMCRNEQAYFKGAGSWGD